jgi:uncharacterized protein (TIGR00299 family) protein
MIGWIDGQAGASGDMLLGALVDAGVPLDVLAEPLDRIGLGVALRAELVSRGSIGATHVVVDAPADDTLRRLADIEAIIGRLRGDPDRDSVVERSLSTFRRLAAAEAHVHRIAIDEVHFHEVGALDAIADIVGVCAGLVHLGLSELHCSTLSLGSGSTRGAHGPIPVPAPAVLELLRDDAQVAAGLAPYESTTPTGAALLAEWVTHWGALPSMVVASIGIGAGSRDSDVLVNACRLVVGSRPSGDSDSMVEVEANIDDLDSRVFPGAITAAIDAGAVDAWVTPIVMKKGRPAYTFSALCPPAAFDAVCEAIFSATTSIGLRHRSVDRVVLDRSMSSVEVSGERIGVKTASRNGVVVNQSIEWDDVAAAARRLGRPTKAVLAEATARLHLRESENQWA